MWAVNQTHSFATFPQGQEPKTVLDIGTGTGLWPISQALVWPESTFVGLDIVPSQTDLSVLARAERSNRTVLDRTTSGEGVWEELEKRVQWDQVNLQVISYATAHYSLKRLPYDTGVFEMVHIRFCGLGVPEAEWGHLLEEAGRVLVKGGTLEIVEMVYSPPPGSPTSIKNSFASLLLSDFIQPNPILPLRFHLPTSSALVPLYKPVFEKTWKDPVLSEAVMVWVRSAMEYRGSGIGKDQTGQRVIKQLEKVANKWAIDGVGEVDKLSEATIWAWVVKRI